MLFTTIAASMLINCDGAGRTAPEAHNSSAASPSGACDDLIQGWASPPPPGALPGVVYVGTKDTYFIGTVGFRWGDNVHYLKSEKSYYMKVAIHTLETHLPKVTVKRVDGQGQGRAQLSPTSDGIPGPVPTGVLFPTPGCWEIAARGSAGVARIYVQVKPITAAAPTP